MQQKIGLFSFTVIVISLVIGMGIFGSVSASAKHAIAPSVYFVAWFIGGIITLCGALTLAEIGSRMPNTGGIYNVFSYAYHPSIAFAFNCIILVSNAASIGVIAILGCKYLFKVMPISNVDDITISISSVVLVLVFYLVNLLGLRASSKLQNILMFVKIGMLLTLIFCLCSTNNYAVSSTSSTSLNISWIQSLGMCLIAVSFAYSGYQQTINFGNEIINPSKTIPKAIFLGITVIVSLYLLVTYSYFKILGFQNIQSQNEIAFAMMNKVFGNNGAAIFSVLLFIGVMSYINALLMSNPRALYAMANDKVLPKTFTLKSKKEVLTVALTTFTTVVVIVLLFAKTFEKILNFSMILEIFGMIANVAAIFIIRKKQPLINKDKVYTLGKLYPYVPIIFILAYGFVGISILINDVKTAAIGVFVLLGFIGIYFVSKQTQNTKTI